MILRDVLNPADRPVRIRVGMSGIDSPATAPVVSCPSIFPPRDWYDSMPDKEVAMPNGLSHRTDRKLSPGWRSPFGATLGLGGVNFSLYSATAEEVWLLLFDRPDGDPTDIIRVQDRDRFAWHV